jgi:hypothetical protein
MRTANLILSGILWAGAAIAADSGAPVPAGATTTKASEMDCDQLQKKVLGELDALKTDPASIGSAKCQLSSKAGANSEEYSVGEEKVKGACEATYATINHYAELSEKKLAEVCTVIRGAKDISASCDQGQKTCVNNLASKDKVAAAKLKELSAILKKAQKELAARQKNLKAVAEKYKKTFEKIDEAILKAGTSGNMESTLTGLPTDGVFGSDSPNAWTALTNNGFQSSDFTNTYRQYSSNLNEGFDSDGDATPKGLGKYTEELAQANTEAAKAIKTVDTAAPRVASAQERFESRSSDLTGTGNGLGGTDGLSTLTGALKDTKAASASLAKATNGAIAASSGLAGLAGLPKSDFSGDSVASAKSDNKISAPSLLGAASAEAATIGSFALPGTNPGLASPTSATQPAAAETGKNELLSSFAPLGAVSEGDELDMKAARTRGLKSAPGSAGASSYISATAKLGKEESLRDALRKRLAERTKAGDAAASSAVEDILYAPQNRAPASEQDSSIDAEQAGPLGIESEPLFSRVHHAHSRFLQRAFPRQAGL